VEQKPCSIVVNDDHRNELSMRQKQSSLTAMGIAVLRATETEKPVGERICSDPLALKFVPSWFYWLGTGAGREGRSLRTTHEMSIKF
jgi:O-methyltransferase involved in polyketide biosynthesis